MFDRKALPLQFGRYYDAPTPWEEVWLEGTRTLKRRFLQGLIQGCKAAFTLFPLKLPGMLQSASAGLLMKLDFFPEIRGSAVVTLRTGPRYAWLAYVDGVCDIPAEEISHTNSIACALRRFSDRGLLSNYRVVQGLLQTPIRQQNSRALP